MESVIKAIQEIEEMEEMEGQEDISLVQNITASNQELLKRPYVKRIIKNLEFKKEVGIETKVRKQGIN